MPAARRRLTDGDVDALFSGTLSAPAGTFAGVRGSRVPDLPARYCHACGEVREDLLSFRGDRDWSPTIPLDSPVRGLVKLLRIRREVRWVVLCTYCIDHAHNYVEKG